MNPLSKFYVIGSTSDGSVELCCSECTRFTVGITYEILPNIIQTAQRHLDRWHVEVQ